MTLNLYDDFTFVKLSKISATYSLAELEIRFESALHIFSGKSISLRDFSQ